MYADFEEKFGLLNHAFEIYDRMVANVPESDKLEAYNLYIAKISYYLGVTKSRPIFEVLFIK
jgi:pre-mRNA-splicing factor SYF1